MRVTHCGDQISNSNLTPLRSSFPQKLLLGMSKRILTMDIDEKFLRLSTKFKMSLRVNIYLYSHSFLTTMVGTIIFLMPALPSPAALHTLCQTTWNTLLPGRSRSMSGATIWTRHQSKGLSGQRWTKLLLGLWQDHSFSLPRQLSHAKRPYFSNSVLLCILVLVVSIDGYHSILNSRNY